ncbi:uncharacterized protein [Haliotis cracherodii]|uniref:uncharacterized protein isoform X2 n=1 Tax=Haliotis cracherodii TaxID=6455 RepID=UPI0039ED2681
MRGVYLFAVLALAATVSSQTTDQCAAVSCDVGRSCVVGPNGKPSCICPRGYYGSTCENSVCAKLKEAASNLDLCTLFGAAATCVGDIAGGEICQCPSTRNGVLCEDAGAPGVSLTDCQRQQRLQSYIIYMLNTTDMRNATLNSLRTIIDANKMKSLLRNSSNQVLHPWECTGQGFSEVQCEVSMDNLNSRQCYCADTRTGEILPGHTKSYTKPTDCSGVAGQGAVVTGQFKLYMGLRPVFNNTSSAEYRGLVRNITSALSQLFKGLPNFNKVNVTGVIVQASGAAVVGYQLQFSQELTTAQQMRFLNVSYTLRTAGLVIAGVRYTPTDPCTNMTCYNGGSCMPLGNSTSCLCLRGYTGYQCETRIPNQNINKSGMCPPRNSTMMGTCVEYCSSDASCPGAEKCCSNGCGHSCQQPIHHPNPCTNMTCYNGGSCMLLGNSTSCLCYRGYTGYQCETRIPNQNINKSGMCPPRNSTMMGMCAEYCSSDASCPGAEKCCSNGCGHSCQQPIHHPNPCTNMTCYNGGSCMLLGNSTSCLCYRGYTGYQCETRIPNQNINKSGMCPPRNSTMMGMCAEYCSSDASCPGAEKCCSNGCGHSCQQPIHHPNPCTNMTCYNGGSCMPLGNSTSCLCYRGYTGYQCETRIPNQNINKSGMCPPRNSTMMGTCAEYCSSDASCPGAEKCCSNGCGHSCQQPIHPPNPCTNMTCYNGGSCMPLGNSTSCLCYRGYTGYQCETRIPNQNINKSGMCPPRNSTMMGTCAEYCSSDASCPGAEKCCSNGCGHSCQQPIHHPNPCTNMTCYNGGSCMPLGNSTSCLCYRGYTGYQCETRIPNQNINKSGMCPPRNSTMMGTCAEYCSSDASCPGAEKCCSNGCGHSCQQPIHHPNPCTNMTCYNGGSCMPLGNSTSCLCYRGYTGYQCETRIPNQNINKSGMCPPRNSTMMGTCAEYCSSDASCPGAEKCCSNGCGHSCQQPIHHPNPCTNMTCYNGGSCMPLGNSTSCLCYRGYTGYQCETRIPNQNINKSGMCPPRNSTMMGMCAEYCSSDASCPGAEKCCSNGCGHSCQQPIHHPSSCSLTCYNGGTCVVRNGSSYCLCQHGYRGYNCESRMSNKSGMCPPRNSTMMGTCVEYCSSDASCPGAEKCCSNGCGHSCQQPIHRPSENVTMKPCVPLVGYSGFANLAINCLTPIMALNTTTLSSSDVCRLFASTVVCARNELRKDHYNCSLMELHGQIRSYLDLIRSNSNMTIPDYSQCQAPTDNSSMQKSLCEDSRGLALYASQSVCLQSSPGIPDTCMLLNGSVACLQMIVKCPVSRIYDAVINNAQVIHQRKGFNFSKCQGPREGGNMTCSSMISMFGVLGEMLQYCMQPFEVVKTTLSQLDKCSMYKSGLACSSHMVRRKGMNCSLEDIHGMLAPYMAMPTSAGLNSTFFNLSYCPVSAADEYSVKPLCNDSYLMAVYTVSSSCMPRLGGQVDRCSLLPTIGSCVYLYTRCPSYITTRALIENSAAVRSRLNFDFSSCSAQGGAIYKYNDSVRLDMAWRNDLLNPSSSFYLSVKSAMRNKLSAYAYIPEFKNLTVTGFWPGSVGVNFTMDFSIPISNLTDQLVSLMRNIENDTVLIDGTTYSFVKSEKDGVCPPVLRNMTGICVHGCTTDGDCARDTKCCNNGCGHTCISPYNNSDSLCFVNDECVNGGTCYRGYCYCAPGYTGTFCNNFTLSADGCSSSPCLNAGSCFPQGNMSYSCICPRGATGTNCEERLCDYFNSNMCLGTGSSCLGDVITGEICRCGNFRKGLFCEEEGHEAVWGCEVLERFSTYLEKVIQNNAAPPPINSAKATNLIGILQKFNLTSYVKPKCNTQNPSQYISPKCEVNMFTSETLCYCVDNYGYIRGNKMPQALLNAADCDRVVNPCESNPCQNNFTCYNRPNGSYECNCPPSYGYNCENVPFNRCQCGPGERCVRKEHCNTSRCRETNICVGYNESSPCDMMPCGANGQCVARAGQGFYCNCYEGYTGLLCKTNTQVCSMFGFVKICNNGVCVGDVKNGMLCRCPEGRRGAFCERLGTAATPCQRQQDLTSAVLRIRNGTMTVPGLTNTSYLVERIMMEVLNSTQLPLTNCSVNGDFAPQQCLRDIYTGAERCYCANSQGQEIYTNVTIIPGHPPCTAPDPADISKVICSTLTNICMNGGTCVGELDNTPQLCACPYGYEGILCERRSEAGEKQENYTMCTFSQDSYNMMMAVMNRNLTLNIGNMTIDRDFLMSSFYKGIMTSFLPVSTPGMGNRTVMTVNNNGTTRVTVIRPNCTLSGEFASMQCEYFLDSGEKHACYCYSPQGRVVPGTYTMAPSFPRCNGTQPQCDDVLCALNCSHGLRKDMRGCPVCECRKPCDGMMCPKGARCVGSGHGGPECRRTMKHGMCPMDSIPTMETLRRMFMETMQNCDMTCHDDADCEGDKKCCGSCGNKCVTPYMPENCQKKKEVLMAHWDLYQNMSKFLQNDTMTSKANQTYPAMMHSAMAWVRTTTHMWRPSCNASGDYERVQCEYNLRTEQKDHCFCSNIDGQRINGTDTRPPTDPVCTVKPGHCPTGMATPTECSVSCRGDYDCGGHDKCCNVGCSARCLGPMNDTAAPHQVANMSALFRSVCVRFKDMNICQSGSQCVGSWERGDLCACPAGYQGPFCDRMLADGEPAPSVCEKRHRLFNMIMDPTYAHFKTMFMTYANMSSLPVMKANCSAGGFNPVQCDHDITDGSRKWCYCVNESGDPIPSSRVPSPHWPRCGDMHCEAGHRLYDTSGHARACDPRSRQCPTGYECKNIAYGKHVCCIDLQGHSDMCRLTPNPGQRCADAEQTWSNYYYYNSTLGRCKLFLYRGCHGNQNKFMTESACNQSCAGKEKPGMCPMMRPSGNQRYCKDYCRTDRNCTEDRKCCQTGCGRRCTLPTVDEVNKKCRVGVEYHHPNGSTVYCGRGQPLCPEGYECNVDPMDGPSFCCPKETVPLNVCHEPREPGPCKAMMPRYFFNRTSEQCQRFTYGGCRGNNNNFNSLEECCSQCGTNRSRCKPGECRKPQPNYFATCQDECKSDSECTGNTRCCSNGCGHVCLVPEMTQTCHMKLREAHMKLQHHKGGCPMISIPRCNYNGTWRSQQCLDSYGICWCVDSHGRKIPNTLVRGYADCSYIPDMGKPATSQPEGEMDLPPICEQGTKTHCCNASLCHMHSCPAHPAAVCRVNPCGGCRAVFYDHMNREVNCSEGLTECQLHRQRVKTAHAQHTMNKMGDMTRNMTMNMTRNMTMGDHMKPGQVEEPESIPPHCQLAPKPGMCRAFMPKWFYNHTSNRCEKFVYGGCNGNDNKFNTVEECYEECHEEANPCKMEECGDQQKCSLGIDYSCTHGKCAHWAECRYVFANPHISGFNVPTCSAEKYTSMQCHHGYCWCVSGDGQPIQGSLAKKYGVICQDDGQYTVNEGQAVNCSNGGTPNLSCLDTCMGKVCPGNPNATCVVNLCSPDCSHKFMMETEEVETCGEDECAVMYAEPKASCQAEPACPPRLCPNVCETQTCGRDPCAMCHVDPCTCQAVFTDMLTNKNITDCAAMTHTHCQMTHCTKKMEMKREMLVTGTTTVYLPTCGPDGRYEPKQCQDDRCWCVDGVGQWLKLSDLYEVCGRNETVNIVITMKFDHEFSLVANKIEEFKRAVIMSIIEGSGIADAEDFIKDIRVYEGSIKVDTTLEDKKDLVAPSAELPVLADMMENRIKSGDMSVKFEGQALVANSGLYSRTNRFEGQPPTEESSTTVMPPAEPEPEPLEQKVIIIISVVAGVVGLVLLSVLVYFCCCQRRNKAETGSQSGSSDYSIEKKQDHQAPAVTNATYGMVYPGTDNRSYKQDEDFIKVRL